MANQEHVKILKQGVAVWNKWRKDNPDIKPDLSRIIIKDILPEKEYDFFFPKNKNKKQIGVLLQSINFRNTNLEFANLQRANLVLAEFKYANLKNVKFQKASLEYARFQRANIKKARFRGQIFMRQNFMMQGF